MKRFMILFSLLISGFSLQTLNAQTIICHSRVTVDLGTNCVVSITPDVIGIDLNPAYNYRLSKSEFSCYDVGRTQSVRLEMLDRKTGALVNSCFSSVTVESRVDPSPCDRQPIYCHSSLTVALNEDGYVVLTPDMISAIPLEDNPYFVYDVIPNVLDCSNIGSNTVRLRVLSACFVEDYCTMTVHVIDTSGFHPTCYYVDTDGMDFFPADLDQRFMLPGAMISYTVDLFSQSFSSSGLNSEFRILLSTDQTPDSKDILLHKQNINLKKKSSLAGQFNLPKKINPGNYFLIADLISKNKKYRISFPNQIQKIQIGSKSKFDDLTPRLSEAKETTTWINVYPNPFQNKLQIVPSHEDHPFQELELYNALGIKLKNMDVDQTLFDTSDLKPGIYLIRYATTKGEKGYYQVLK